MFSLREPVKHLEALDAPLPFIITIDSEAFFEPVWACLSVCIYLMSVYVYLRLT